MRKKTGILASLLLILSVWQSLASNGLAGIINDATPFVEVPFSLSEASLVTADVRPTSGDLDTLIYIIDDIGNILIENDDRSSQDTSSQVANLRLPAGNYTLIITRFGVLKGNTNGDYTASINTVPDVTQETTLDTSASALLATGFPELAPREKASWTVLAYMGADTNLEEALLADLDEFERGGGSNEQVNIIAFVDRSPYYSTANGDWKTGRIYEMTDDTTGDYGDVYPPTIDSTLIADLGTQDSGKGQTLAQFLVWGVQTFPAERYIVTIGGHGGAWRGLVVDDTNQSAISLSDLREAFSRATQTAGVPRFDLLVNDACSMASIEYFDTINEFFGLSIASPEIVSNPALDMTLLTESVRNDMSLLSTASGMAEAYVTRDLSVYSGTDRLYDSMVVTDLTAFTRITETTEAFATLISTDPQRFAPLISQAYSNAYKPSNFISNNDKLDLGHFMGQVIALTDNPSVIRAARDVVTALDEARLYGTAASLSEKFTSYYNIYFPPNSASFDASYFTDSPLKAWGQMLSDYFNVVSPRLWRVEESLLSYHPPQAPEVTVTTSTPQANAQFVPVVGLQVRGRNLYNGSFIVDVLRQDGRKQRLLNTDILTVVSFEEGVEQVNYWKSGIDISEFRWEPFTLWQVTDGSSGANELVVRTEQSLVIDGLYEDDSTPTPLEITLSFDRASNILSAVRKTGITYAPITLKPDGQFTAYQYFVLGNGNTKPEAGNAYRVGDLQFIEVAPPDGTYELGFLITTFAGISGYDAVSVAVDSGLNSAPEALTTTEGLRWEYAFTSRNLPYPIPQTWLTAFSQARFTPPNASDTLTFALLSEVANTSPLQALTEALARTAPNAQNIQDRAYVSDFTTWQSIGYSDTVNNTAIHGRFYATLIDGMTYLWHFQAPESTALALLREVFEPMLDGFAPPLTATLTPNDLQPTLIKSALVLAKEVCANARLNSACVGQGVATFSTQENRVTSLPDGAYAKSAPLSAPSPVGSIESTQTLFSANIGENTDGTIDPFSATVFHLQAGLNSDSESVQIVAFGGVTVRNDSLNPSLTLQNITGNSVNVRQLPFIDALVLQVLEVAAQVQAVGISENGRWLRVLLPNSMDGWVLRELLNDAPEIADLPISNPEERYYAPMERLTIFLSGDSAETRLLNGVLIIVPHGFGNAYLNINGYDIELAEGSVVLWQGDSATAIDTNEGDVGLVATRRPSQWTFEVLKGVTRLKNGDQMLTSVGGTAFSVDANGAQLSTSQTATRSIIQNALNGSSETRNNRPLTDEEVNTLREAQNTLNNTPLSNLRELEHQYQRPQNNNQADEDETPPVSPSRFVTSQTQTTEATPTPAPDLPLNKCDVGGEWYGLCDNPDPDIRAWYYNSAWYLQQYEAGNITVEQLPVELQPSTPEPLPASTEPPYQSLVLEESFTCDFFGGTGSGAVRLSAGEVNIVSAYVTTLSNYQGELMFTPTIVQNEPIGFDINCNSFQGYTTVNIRVTVMDSNYQTYELYTTVYVGGE